MVRLNLFELRACILNPFSLGFRGLPPPCTVPPNVAAVQKRLTVGLEFWGCQGVGLFGGSFRRLLVQ